MLIAIVGKAGSGKDTAANCLVNSFDKVYTMALADPLKHFVQDVYQFTDEQLYGPSEKRNAIDARWGFSPREALQKLGTEWGRALHEDTWVRYALRGARAVHLRYGESVVFTDCRFLNEAAAVRAEGGQVWRIIRPGAGLSGEAGQHPSETEQDRIEADVEIMNDGTLADLRNMVRLAGMKAGLR